MQFNSYEFIFLLMPAAVISYFLLNKISYTLGKIGLVIASVIFYLYAGLDVALGLGVSIVVNYFFALYLSKVQKGRKAIKIKQMSIAYILSPFPMRQIHLD